MTTGKVLSSYEKELFKALINSPAYNPLNKTDKEKIKQTVINCLGIDKIQTPEIKVNEVKDFSCEGIRIKRLTGYSWEGVTVTADFYLPANYSGEVPAVLLCCGHGAGGKLNPGYQAMARYICRQGFAVLVPDNIGQGEREPMGHKNEFAPFACRTSVQGLITLENLGWVNWLKNADGINNERISAIGNSGGGTATLFLSILSDKLFSIVSSGYPSTFEFIARKEKAHCACNLIPSIVGKLEMHDIYGCYCPNPILLMQGKNDNLFPEDIFLSTASKVRNIYMQAEKNENFSSCVVEGVHSWDLNRRNIIGKFLCKANGIDKKSDAEKYEDEKLFEQDNTILKAWPESSLNTAQLAMTLTGEKTDPDITLEEIYLDKDEHKKLQGFSSLERCSLARFIAQIKCFMAKGHSK